MTTPSNRGAGRFPRRAVTGGIVALGLGAACVVAACSARRAVDAPTAATAAASASGAPRPDGSAVSRAVPVGSGAPSAGSAAEAPTFRTGLPPAPTALRELVRAGRTQVETFFGLRIPEAYQVALLPDRAAFDRLAAERWRLERTECWMVAVGVGSGLVLLDPAAWSKHACDHDPTDAAHVRSVVAHELVHVLHDQLNPTDEFAGLEPLEWFVEGLAVLASGQLDERRRARVRALAAGADWPTSLATLFRGNERYGLAGSVVAFVDAQLGRRALVELLSATTSQPILAALGMTEPELLAAWRAALLATPAKP